MVIFHSYVKLPEGNSYQPHWSPEPWESLVNNREIIPCHGPRIQVSEIWSKFTQNQVMGGHETAQNGFQWNKL